jgi:hypothetical protein
MVVGRSVLQLFLEVLLLFIGHLSGDKLAAVPEAIFTIIR